MTSLVEPYLVTRNLSDYQPPSWPGYKASGFPGSSLIQDSLFIWIRTPLEYQATVYLY